MVSRSLFQEPAWMPETEDQGTSVLCFRYKAHQRCSEDFSVLAPSPEGDVSFQRSQEVQAASRWGWRPEQESTPHVGSLASCLSSKDQPGTAQAPHKPVSSVAWGDHADRSQRPWPLNPKNIL